MAQLAYKVLMVRPASFGFNTETAVNNAFQGKETRLSPQEIAQKAIAEFDKAVEILRAQQIEVLVIQDTEKPPKPDAVFPNNWFCTLPTGKIVLFPMFAPNRREEKRDDILQQLMGDFKVRDVEDWSEFEAENFFLEGTGSMIFDHENMVVYACISSRTHKSLFEKFAHAHGYQPIHFLSKDEKNIPIYHTNVMMHIGESYAVICLDSIKNKTERIYVSQQLTESGHEIIPITQEQVRHFAGNMMQVKNKNGKKYTILSQTAFDALSTEQKDIFAFHTQLLPIPIETIETFGGGSARCMVAEIFLQK
ncbi:citrulline utilization hydrolase CtlX [Arachidicoccus soli]|nr:arginine deiminase-related protein [Arachidicoccus soli]